MENRDGELIVGKGGECIAIENGDSGQNGRQQRSLFDAFPEKFKKAKLRLPEGSLSAGKYVNSYNVRYLIFGNANLNYLS